MLDENIRLMHKQLIDLLEKIIKTQTETNRILFTMLQFSTGLLSSSESERDKACLSALKRLAGQE